MKRKAIVWLGSSILIATALFHATGFSIAATASKSAALNEFMSAVLPGLWLFPSYHWFFVAIVAGIAATEPSRLARLTLWASALLLVVDVVLLFAFVGAFIGEALLALSAVCYVVASSDARRNRLALPNEILSEAPPEAHRLPERSHEQL